MRTQTASPRKKVFVCSPYRAISLSEKDAEQECRENGKRVRQACRLLVDLGCMPLAPHAYFTTFLNDDDPDERSEGMSLGSEWLATADELWVFGERISDGMMQEIGQAIELGIPVFYKPEPTKLVEELISGLQEESNGGTADADDDISTGRTHHGK